MNSNFWYFYKRYYPILLNSLKEIGEETLLKDTASLILTSQEHIPAILTILATKLLLGNENDALEYAILIAILNAVANAHTDLIDINNKSLLEYSILVGDSLLLKAIEIAYDLDKKELFDKIYEYFSRVLEAKMYEKRGEMKKAIKSKASIFSLALEFGSFAASNKNYIDILTEVGKLLGIIYYSLVYLVNKKIDKKTAESIINNALSQYETLIRKLPQNGYREILRKAAYNIIDSFKEKYSIAKELNV